MKRLPARSNLDHLKKQAKELLRDYRSQQPSALSRFRESLPAAAGKNPAQLSSFHLRLADAQSCVAREYGFASWADLKSYVEAHSGESVSLAERLMRWLSLVYAGEISGTMGRAHPGVAARLLAESPELATLDPSVAFATGDEKVLHSMLAADRDWIHRTVGPLKLPPLVAVTHSSLLRLPEFQSGLHRCAKLLLDAGADPNQSVGSRWPPASLEHPSKTDQLSALYGPAGQHHDVELTHLLLNAGADPNDGESLYHSLENPACTELLLKAGARIAGSNAMYRVLDMDNLKALQLLLAAGGNPEEPVRHGPPAELGTPLLWAIRRGRSAAHIEELLRAGADPCARTPKGVGAYRLALWSGMTQVAELLQKAGGVSDLSMRDQFIAACARADTAEAQSMLDQHPGMLANLSDTELRLLPDLAEAGATDAVETMVKLGWPIAVTGGDWQASALNLAVFRGDADLARFLLEHGASWTEKHGFGDDVSGTLSWASCNEPVSDGDWLGCAQLLVEHGMPVAPSDPASAGCVVIDGRRKYFSEDVVEFLLSKAQGDDSDAAP